MERNVKDTIRTAFSNFYKGSEVICRLAYTLGNNLAEFMDVEMMPPFREAQTCIVPTAVTLLVQQREYLHVELHWQDSRPSARRVIIEWVVWVIDVC